MLQPIFWEKIAGGPFNVASKLVRPVVDDIARQMSRGSGSAIQRGRMRKFMPDTGAGKNTVIDVAGKAAPIQPVIQSIGSTALVPAAKGSTALVPAAKGSTALAPSVRGSTELMPYAGGAGGGGKLPPGTATASGADDFLGGTRPFKPTGAETIIDPKKKFPWKRYLAGGAAAAGTGAGIYNAYQPEPGAAASLTNQLGPLAEASKPGLMEQLQGYGTSAMDWIKENPGLAAGGIGIPLLLYILSQQSRDDEKNASFAQQLGQQLARS
jgi:hypothetical protein